MDLHGELARGRDDERARMVDAPLGRRLAPEQRRVHRDEECRGLARAGLRLSRDVEARERARQRLRLDPGAALEARVGDAAGEGLGQMKVGKGNFAEVCV
jgi:hypothetical protein